MYELFGKLTAAILAVSCFVFSGILVISEINPVASQMRCLIITGILFLIGIEIIRLITGLQVTKKQGDILSLLEKMDRKG